MVTSSVQSSHVTAERRVRHRKLGFHCLPCCRGCSVSPFTHTHCQPLLSLRGLLFTIKPGICRNSPAKSIARLVCDWRLKGSMASSGTDNNQESGRYVSSSAVPPASRVVEEGEHRWQCLVFGLLIRLAACLYSRLPCPGPAKRRQLSAIRKKCVQQLTVVTCNCKHHRQA